MVRLPPFLRDNHLDGFLFLGDSLCDPDLYYISRFLAGDRFALLAAERTTLLVSGMERGRASSESRADKVVTTSDYGIKEKLRTRTPDHAYLEVLLEFLKDQGIERLGVSKMFPVGIYKGLTDHFQVLVLDSPVPAWRAKKSLQEVEAIKEVQLACEEAMNAALNLIRRSEPSGEILLQDDVPLTSEKVRSTIEMALLEKGCEAMDTIVAGGPQSANPHSRGSGTIPANEPIVLDIFPRSKTSRYFADMTRTVVRGEAPPEVKDMYEAVKQAQDVGLKTLRAGIKGSEVHSRVCQVFQELGYPLEEKGFIHSTGHGVGLAVHETPSLSDAGEVLQEGNIVTVEPGLYFPEIGGVRLEDMALVKEGGCMNLTNFKRSLVL
jgi:Xaa-Pro aminopeptidase